jgi:hypothetical protein
VAAGLRATTINAAGVHEDTFQRIGVNPAALGDVVHNVHVEHEVLTSLQSGLGKRLIQAAPIVGPASVLTSGAPAAFGKQEGLPVAGNKPENPFERHKVGDPGMPSAVLDALNKQYGEKLDALHKLCPECAKPE